MDFAGFLIAVCARQLDLGFSYLIQLPEIRFRWNSTALLPRFELAQQTFLAEEISFALPASQTSQTSLTSLASCSARSL